MTIAIPTWNRATYLEKNLTQLHRELAQVAPGRVEVLVSDNCSSDSTADVVAKAEQRGMEIRYVRNDENLGWARNFAQCFDLARGKYVLMLGDDDLFVDGTLSPVLACLAENDYGVVTLRPFGYDLDFRKEHPGGGGHWRVFQDADKFLLATSRWFTLTSACILNKRLLAGVDSREFIWTDLATFHLVLRAALAAKENLSIDQYLIASKRQNSSSYDYVDVFVRQFWMIIDSQMEFGLAEKTVRALERDRLFAYYPFYLLDMRLADRQDLQSVYDAFAERFNGSILFKVWLAPIIVLPKPLGIAWGAISTVVGRVASGDLRRGIKFAWDRTRHAFGR